MIMENKSNENLMENQSKCANSITSENDNSIKSILTGKLLL